METRPVSANLQMTRILQMATNSSSAKVLYADLSYKIVGLCFDVHNELGQFAREKQYADLLEKRFKAADVKFLRELRLGETGNIVDFLVEDKIVLELKTARVVGRIHFRQLQNYLQQSRIKLGLLVNFSDKYLRPKRVLCSNS